MRIVMFILDALILFAIGYVLASAYTAGEQKGKLETEEKLSKKTKKEVKK